MYTDILPNAHGVKNELLSADLARIKKSTVKLSALAAPLKGVVSGIRFMGVTHALPGPAMTKPFSHVAIGGGAFGLGNHPLGVPPQHRTIAAGLGGYAARPSTTSPAAEVADVPECRPGRHDGSQDRALYSVAVRNQRNAALQQQQLANAGVSSGGGNV
ncbi:unnamed protein product [Ectocarpus sp. CCAP 1310/34]|nr:unnamed protein product [Ectocarpus sp. CCAP 1310/34]